MKKWVTLLAYGPSLAMWEQEIKGEVWAMNLVEKFIDQIGAPQILDLVTTRFDMHGMERWDEVFYKSMSRGGWHVEWMEKTGGRVISRYGERGTTAYPLDDVERMLGIEKVTDRWGQPFWWAQIIYMLGLALYEGFDGIHIIGADLVAKGYREQREGFNYLLGYAFARGIEVTGETVARGAVIQRYGYDDLSGLRESESTKITFIKP